MPRSDTSSIAQHLNKFMPNDRITKNSHRKQNNKQRLQMMMAQSWVESTWEINDYGRFINQFLPNIIRSRWQFERINKKNM